MFHLLKCFFRRISKDFKQKKLLPLKLIFFVQASTLHVLYPYLTIHMRELGINVEETAIMSAITPFVAIIMPPVAGLIADRIGNFKVLLSFFSSLGGAAALLLLLVPIGRVTVKYPNDIIMDLSCNSKNNDLMLAISDTKYNCLSIIDKEVKTKIESCGFVCQLNNQTNVDRILKSRSYHVKYFDYNDNHNYLFKYNRPKADYMQVEMSDTEIKEHRKYKNHEFYKTAIRLLKNNTIYFPTGELYKFLCFNNYTNKILCKFQNNNSQLQNEDQQLELNAKLIVNNTKKSKLEYKIDGLTFDHLNTKYNQVKCENPYAQYHKISVTIPESFGIDDDSSEVDNLATFDECREKCLLTTERKNVCSNLDTVIEYNISLTFWLYLGIRVFIGIISGTAFAMFEGAVIAILREQEADYGLQRIYGSIGSMISSPLSGMLIDYASEGKDYADFRPAFYLYAALKIASGLLMLAINLEFKAPAHNVVGDVISVLKNIEIVALLLACFVLGSAWGYIESFLFWLIQDLGGSRSLMGITITVGGIAGIPLLVLSGPIIDKIGHANVLFIGFVFYAVRLLGYSLIYNPWLCLIFEALESVTSSLSFTAAVTYAAKLSTISTDSSIQGLLGGLYYGVGKGSGSLIGGFLMKAFGTRPTYQIFAVVCLICGLVYFFFNLFYLKKRPQVEGNAIVKKKPKKDAVENGVDGLNQKETKEMSNVKGNDNLAFDDEKTTSA